MHIIGHEHERARLKQSIEGEVVQSYLFTGPRSVGKALCALEFASALVGEPSFEPSSDKPTPYDVRVLRPLEETKRGITKKKSIPAEEVREGLSFLSQYPARGRYRVLIILDAHRLSETAQNVLLKTLEEPVSSAVIILVTHEVGAILPTVLSRVKRVRFGFVSEGELRGGVEGLPGDTSAIAPFFYGLGRPGMIMSALERPEDFATSRELLGSLYRLSTLSLAERMSLAERLGSETERAVELLEWWLPGLHEQAKAVKERPLATRYYALLENVTETMHLLKTTQSNARLLLEKLFFGL